MIFWATVICLAWMDVMLTYLLVSEWRERRAQRRLRGNQHGD